MLKARRWAFFLVIFFTVFLGDLATATAASPGWPLLDEVRSLAEKYYIKPVDPAKLQEGAVRGLLKSLGDPYNEYIAPEEVSGLTRSLDDEYIGVGIILRNIEGRVVITGVVPGSPAARQGVKSGSVLVAVDGRAVEGLSLEEIVRMLGGKPDTRLILTIIPPGSDSRHDYSLRREVIRPPVVGTRLMAGVIGYLYLRSFSSWAAEEVAAALAQLEASGARGLILDLRGNPGGYLDAAGETASLFLLRGKTIVKIVGRDKQVRVLRSRGPGQDLPLVVLVDGDTASAAEILAGALQANHVALLVGTRTYGKGAVQTIFPLSNGGVLKLTTAYYFTPDGQAIDGEGLRPDIEVTGGQEQLDRALQVLRAQIAPPLVAGNLACR